MSTMRLGRSGAHLGKRLVCYVPNALQVKYAGGEQTERIWQVSEHKLSAWTRWGAVPGALFVTPSRQHAAGGCVERQEAGTGGEQGQ
jgi:hypothetical protein